jgi:hypothetical protein
MKYFDQPVAAFKSMDDYKDVIKLARSRDYAALEKWIYDHEKELSDLINGDGFSVINSEHAADIVIHCLKKVKIDYLVHFGILDGESWVWLEAIDDEYINAERYAESVKCL